MHHAKYKKSCMAWSELVKFIASLPLSTKLRQSAPIPNVKGPSDKNYTHGKGEILVKLHSFPCNRED